MNHFEYQQRVIALFKSGKATEEQWLAMASCVNKESEASGEDASPIDRDPMVRGPLVTCPHCSDEVFAQDSECWFCGEALQEAESVERSD